MSILSGLAHLIGLNTQEDIDRQRAEIERNSREKPCTACKHYQEDGMCAGRSWVRQKINPVTGKQTLVRAEDNRFNFDYSYGDPGHCTPLGRWFEPKA